MDKKDKNIAGLLAFLVGGFGVHRFYLNQIGLGVLYIFLTIFTCGAFYLVNIIEAIVFWTMDDRSFDIKYNGHLNYQTRQAYNQAPNPQVQNRQFDVLRDSPSPVQQPRQQQPPRQQAPQRQQRPVKQPVKRPTPAKKPTGIPNPFKASGVKKFREYDFEGALKAFKKALKIDSKDKAVHFNLGCCYSVMEDIQKSLYHLDQAVQNGFADFNRIHKHDSLAFLRAHDEFEDFAKNGYRLPKAETSETPQLNAPKENLLDDNANDLLDQLDKQGEKEEILLTEDQVSDQMKTTAKDIFNELFDDDFDAPAPKPEIPEGIQIRIKQLEDLKNQGILSEEQFQEQKRKLLG